jgi:hypothetical protein
MGGLVTAQYIIGGNSGLKREQVDKIIEILGITDGAGQLLKPPVGPNCNYKLVLEKADIDVPTNGSDTRT